VQAAGPAVDPPQVSSPTYGCGPWGPCLDVTRWLQIFYTHKACKVYKDSFEEGFETQKQGIARVVTCPDFWAETPVKILAGNLDVSEKLVFVYPTIFARAIASPFSLA